MRALVTPSSQAGRVSPRIVSEFRERLRGARTQPLRTAAVTDKELATVDIKDAREDGAALTMTSATLLRLKDHERRELTEIEQAEARLARGDFGMCAECGTAIALTRLRALPTARLCLRCQAREEEGRRAGAAPAIQGG